MFLYLIAVRLINKKVEGQKSNFQAIVTFCAAAIGALSLAFSDTFWFNAVEAEVYALSTFFIAFVTWLIILWNEKADEPDSEKYLIMIAYLVGLSTGVHLMSVLATVPIVMIIMFRKYLTDEETLKKTGLLFIIHAAILTVIAIIMWAGETDTAPPSYEAYKEIDTKFLAIFGGVSLIFMGTQWKKIFQRNSFYLPIIIGGIALVAVYPGVVKYIPKLINVISGNDVVMNIVVFAAIFVILGYLIYWSQKEKKTTLNLIFKCSLFVLIGFTTYSMILIRSNENPPINLNSPKNMSEVVSYVNREQYGDFPTWKRRYSQEPHQQDIYTEYSSDLSFLYSYQINHMFNRYLLWNYAGRNSTVQDAGVDYSKLLAIPLILGLLGLFFHFKNDWKLASVFLVMFIFLGYLTAFYQNQQEPQPRERDYFYVGAFFVYSIWIAIGVRGIIDLIMEFFKESKIHKHITTITLFIAFLAVPVSMLKVNYFEHDRSRNFVPWDYSYNLLQSCAPNAIIFTNGDNDTFPLWYLQDVEGVRRDVRIANLSLLNTDWYIRQLRDTEPHGASKVPMTLNDVQISKIGPQQFDPKMMSINVPPEVLKEYNVKDTSIIKSGKITWRMMNTMQYGNIKAIRAQEIVALDIIRANNWQRPIYFAVTSSEQSQLSLGDYLIMDGLAFRLVPYKVGSFYEAVNEPVLSKQIFNEPEGFSKDYQPGFKFRGLNDSTIFFDDNHRRMGLNYRNSFIRLALYYLHKENNSQKAIEVLDLMEQKLPRKLLPYDYRLMFDISRIYFNAGAIDKFKDMVPEIEKGALRDIDRNPLNFSSDYNPYQILIETYDKLKDYDKLINLLTKIQGYIPDDPSVKMLINRYKQLAKKDSSEMVPQTLDQK